MEQNRLYLLYDARWRELNCRGIAFTELRRIESFQLYPPLKIYFPVSILTESLPMKGVESIAAPVRTASVLLDDKSDKSVVLK